MPNCIDVTVLADAPVVEIVKITSAHILYPFVFADGLALAGGLVVPRRLCWLGARLRRTALAFFQPIHEFAEFVKTLAVSLVQAPPERLELLVLLANTGA